MRAEKCAEHQSSLRIYRSWWSSFGFPANLPLLVLGSQSHDPRNGRCHAVEGPSRPRQVRDGGGHAAWESWRSARGCRRVAVGSSESRTAFKERVVVRFGATEFHSANWIEVESRRVMKGPECIPVRFVLTRFSSIIETGFVHTCTAANAISSRSIPGFT